LFFFAKKEKPAVCLSCDTQQSIGVPAHAPDKSLPQHAEAVQDKAIEVLHENAPALHPSAAGRLMHAAARKVPHERHLALRHSATGQPKYVEASMLRIQCSPSRGLTAGLCALGTDGTHAADRSRISQGTRLPLNFQCPNDSEGISNKKCVRFAWCCGPE
jgi:hypothetical protein